MATPTGSTAYNLSAGGPILTPEIPATVITPICPHSLTNRPLTIPDTSQIQIQLTQEKQKAIFMIDGYRQIDLTYKDKILIKHSNKFHHMLLPHNTNQLEILRFKTKIRTKRLGALQARVFWQSGNPGSSNCFKISSITDSDHVFFHNWYKKPPSTSASFIRFL